MEKQGKERIEIYHLETSGNPAMWKTHKKFLRQIIESEGLKKSLFRKRFTGKDIIINYEDTDLHEEYGRRSGVHYTIQTFGNINIEEDLIPSQLFERLYMAVYSTRERGEHKILEHIAKNLTQEKK